jgi:hypothetical protein
MRGGLVRFALYFSLMKIKIKSSIIIGPFVNICSPDTNEGPVPFSSDDLVSKHSAQVTERNFTPLDVK